MKARLHGEQGSVLATVMVVAGLVGIVLLAYLTMTSGQNTFAVRSLAWNSAIPMAEAGVEEALAHLNYSGTTNLASDGWVKNGAVYTFDRTLKGGYAHITLSTSSPPVIISTGYVRAPFQTNYYISRAIRAPTRMRTPFMGGVTTKGSITLSGGSVVDSFDSCDPLHSLGGQYNIATRKDNGLLQTTSTSAGAINVGTAKVYGDVATGPGGTVSVGSSGAVGDILFVANPLNAGTIETGHLANDVNLSIQDAQMPDLSGSWGTPSSGAYNGTNYLYKLTGGTYNMASVSLSDSSKNMVITGEAILYVSGDFTISGSGYVYVAPGGNFKLYVGALTGSSVSATISGDGIANGTGLAANFTLYGLPTCTKVTYSGSAQFVGGLYAPQADITMSGSAAGVGALVGKTANFSGGMSFHYDECLGGNPAKYVLTAWQEL